MKSMTGFGRAQAVVPNLAAVVASEKASGKSPSRRTKKGVQGALLLKRSDAPAAIGNECEIDVSVRSVNGRFLEIRVHAPREYAEIESELKKQIGAFISRGTVDAYIHRKGSVAPARATARPDLAKTWLKAVRELARETGLKAEPTLELLLKIPDVVQIDDRVELGLHEKKAAFKAVGDAAKLCDSERRREGKALRSDLEALLGQLSQIVGRIEGLCEEAAGNAARKYQERLAKLSVETAVDPARLAQEIAVILERADVSEEISRLREHIAAYAKLLSSDSPQGKKLDFYAQELLRETNTIGSKSHSASLTAATVDAKATIERIREQVQNAE